MQRRTAAAALLTLILLGSFTCVLTPSFEEASGGRTFLDISPMFDMQEQRSYLASLDAEARAVYRTMQLLDMLFPLAYLSLILSLIPGSGPGKSTAAARTAAVAAALADYLENIIIFFMLRTGSPNRLLPFITAGKFLLLGTAVLLLVYLRIRRARSLFKV